MTARSSPSGMPTTGTVLGRPDFAPVVVSITTGKPVNTLVKVWRPFDVLYTARSMGSRDRARIHVTGAIPAVQRTIRRTGPAASYEYCPCTIATPLTVGRVAGRAPDNDISAGPEYLRCFERYPFM